MHSRQSRHVKVDAAVAMSPTSLCRDREKCRKGTRKCVAPPAPSASRGGNSHRRDPHHPGALTCAGRLNVSLAGHYTNFRPIDEPRSLKLGADFVWHNAHSSVAETTLTSVRFATPLSRRQEPHATVKWTPDLGPRVNRLLKNFARDRG